MSNTKTEIINDLINDGLPFCSDIYYEEFENGKYTWTSLPNVWQKNSNDSYYYVIHCHGKTEHISASKIINANPQYKAFLKDKMKETNSPQISVIKGALKVSKKKRKKKNIKKLLKKNKRKWKKKYLKKGKRKAYKNVFREDMQTLGKRMRSRLNKKSVGTNKCVRKQISPTLMKKYGVKKLEKSANNKQQIYDVFGAENFAKKDSLHGKFKIYNVRQKYRSNSKWFTLNFNVKHKAIGKKFYSYENGIYGK